jgi:glycosyltransferase involved in cell wall biosynthesis
MSGGSPRGSETTPKPERNVNIPWLLNKPRRPTAPIPSESSPPTRSTRVPSSEARHLGLFVRSQEGGGGAERVMLNLATWLSGRGHRVDLVMGRAQGHFLDRIPSGVGVFDLGAHIAARALPSLVRLPSTLPHWKTLLWPGAPRVIGAIPALVHYLRRERPDAMLSALNYTNIAALLARRAAGTGTRTVVSVHNHLSTAVANASSPSLRAVPVLAGALFPEADGIVAVSQGVAADLATTAHIEPGRITTIYNPVVTPELTRLAEEPAGHPWLAEGGDPVPVVLAAGKLKPQKDFPTLLRAFAQLLDKREARLIILGEGPDLESLRALAASLGIEGRVDFPGFVDNPFALMRRASVFALSSAWEGFGMVLVEAMACGCPVVSTDCESGPREILGNGRHGALVPVGDAPSLAAALDATLARPPDRDTLIERAGQYRDEKSALAYEALLLGAGSSPGVDQ